jgi:hypothetical protein
MLAQLFASRSRQRSKESLQVCVKVWASQWQTNRLYAFAFQASTKRLTERRVALHDQVLLLLEKTILVVGQFEGRGQRRWVGLVSHSSAVWGCWLSHLHHCHLRKRNQISIASTPIKIGTETNPIISPPKCFESAKAVHERAVTSPTTRALPSVQFVVVCISEGTFHNILVWQYPQQIVR